MTTPGAVACRLCEGPAGVVAHKTSAFSGRDYVLRRCSACRFVFVANPWLDYGNIYDEQYYGGSGADPSVDYLYEVAHFQTTIRQHEWRGVASVVGSLVALGPSVRWLDYGCGLGGLVRFLRSNGLADAFGFEQGWGASKLEDLSVPHISDSSLASNEASFDVVTAIEVIEHLADPLEGLRTIRSLLRPGGLLFMTTGNASPWQDRLTAWRYMVPDVHVSFFEPHNLALALTRAGFSVSFPGFVDGWSNIMRYKLLKAMRRKRTSTLDNIVPWDTLAKNMDRRLHLSAHPVGWA